MAETTQQTKNVADSDLDLLLMGKSGHGKSSTGNSILGFCEFTALGGARSVTKTYQVGYREFEGRVIKVVDIPGVCDAGCASEEDRIDLVQNAIKDGLSLFPDGFSALVLVLSYSARFTKEESIAIETLKSLLGDDILRKHTICVFTHGDDFEFDHKEKFQSWIWKQGGSLKEVMTELDYRTVLFDNRTTDARKTYAQLNELVGKIEGKLARYPVEKFLSAGKMKDEEKEAALLVERCSRDVGLIRSEISKTIGSMSPEKVKSLEKINRDIDMVIDNLPKKVTQHLIDLKQELQEMKESVIELITLIQKQDADRQRDKQEREILIQKHEQAKLEQIRKREALNQMQDQTRDQLEREKEALGHKHNRVRQEEERAAMVLKQMHEQWRQEQEKEEKAFNIFIRQQEETWHKREKEIEEDYQRLRNKTEAIEKALHKQRKRGGFWNSLGNMFKDIGRIAVKALVSYLTTKFV